MIVKVINSIYIEVADTDEAEAASGAIDSMLPHIMSQSGFPHGDVLGVDIDHYEEVSPEEIEERGLAE